MTEEQALKLASVFEKEYPKECHEAEAMLKQNRGGMELLNYIRGVTKMDLMTSVQIKIALEMCLGYRNMRAD